MSFAINVDRLSEQLPFIVVGCFVEALPFVVIAFFASQSLRRSNFVSALIFATVWTILETLREVGTWGIPFDSVSIVISRSRLAMLAPLIGSIGLSFVIVFSCTVLSYAFAPRSQLRVSRRLLNLLPAALLLGCYYLDPQEAHSGQHTEAIVVFRGGTRTLREIRRLVEMAHVNARPIAPIAYVFPEASTEQAVDFGDLVALERQSRRLGSAIFVGLVSSSGSKLSNNVEIFSRYGYVTYTKRQLVPFGEYLPAPGIFGLLGITFNRSFSAGRQPISVRSHDLELSPLICYEGGFLKFEAEGVQHGADVFITSLNDKWFADSSGLLFQYSLFSLRARESGRDMVVASSFRPAAIARYNGAIDGGRSLSYEATIFDVDRPKRTAFEMALQQILRYVPAKSSTMKI